MHRSVLPALCLSVSFITVAAAENSVPATVISTTPVVTSTASFAAPDVSTTPPPVMPPVVSSMTTPVDRIENVHLRRLVGTLRTIDPAANKLGLEDHEGKLSEFILTKRTRVTTEDGHRVAVSVLKPGDRVMIRYVENYNYVRKIDLLSAPQADPAAGHP